MARLWCRVVLLVLVLATRDALAAGAPGADQDVPYLDDVQLIKIHMPLATRDRGDRPCAAPGQQPCGGPGDVQMGVNCTPSPTSSTTTTTTTTTTSTTATPATSNDTVSTEADETATVYPPNEIVVPDVATVDVLFSNMSRRNGGVPAFDFGGVFEVIVNKTERSVDVILTRVPEVMAMAAPAEPVHMVVRGPSAIGINGLDDDDDDDDDADDGGDDDDDDDDDDDGVADDDYNDDDGDDDVDVDINDNDDDGVDDTDDVLETFSINADSYMDVTMRDQIQAELLGRSRWPKGRRHAARRRRAHPIYINGTALSGNQLCNIAFNVSGEFRLNRTMTASTTTVIITQFVSFAETHKAGLLRGTKESMIGTSGGVAMTSIFAVLGMTAGMVLLAAIIVSVMRSRRRHDAVLQGGNNGYSTIESANEAWRSYATFA